MVSDLLDDPGISSPSQSATDQQFKKRLNEVQCWQDRGFCWLLSLQWVAAVGLAVTISPYTWVGRMSSVHLHVYFALVVGGLISLPSILLTIFRPGWVVTRHAVAVSQILFSALFVHLTGGRIETHFHIFGSLAFLSYYRDWKVLVTATSVAALDHLLRGAFWPESIYGQTNPEWWRLLEHAWWMIFEDSVLVMGISQNLSEMRLLAQHHVRMGGVNAHVESEVEKRTAELHASREEYRSLIEGIQAMPWRWHRRTQQFTYVGPQAADIAELSAEAWLDPGVLQARVHPDDSAAVMQHFDDVASDLVDFEFRFRHVDGTWKTWHCILNRHNTTRAEEISGVFVDVTAQHQMEFELAQAQKLESVGRLASGIAHEINTPIQFVSNSLTFVSKSVDELLALVEIYRAAPALQHADAQTQQMLQDAEQATDLEYLRKRVPRALERSVEGLTRVADLVRSMKEFAHPDQKSKVLYDVNHIISTVLTIAHNEYKYVADIVTHYGDVPQIPCVVGELSQALLNLIVNASHAIDDVVKGTQQRGTITITTRADTEHVEIRISDTGGGMAESVQGRIFEPFFTTKEVGRGTGQGLTIARSVVVDKHAGTLRFETELGRGTSFIITLPRTEAVQPAVSP